MNFETYMYLALGLWALIVLWLFILCGWTVWGGERNADENKG